ncbi:hybrid sensor histidine kinase/response regulator [Chroococcidiopsis cubana CCALA 043]|uniref:hybrid sensor histidine kinase/response regulator n=1 Tax=Chroococcidiopsis cubana TaxID=171392 RepID=UPI000D07151A|nr:response regulator [Chroococcidiopsis cubana]PSB55344.1 hybrid sensor histidine kinase/response regulator [Chroococcidiopsis cubana CCALA 043]
MTQDKEREIQLQFLEEAQDHLDAIESKLIGVSSRVELTRQEVDAMLRSAHSIKGGAAMMEFSTLSHLAHRLENFFKVIRTQKQIQPEVERLLLSAVDCLRHVVTTNRQTNVVDEQWQTSQVQPLFEQLQQILGEPREEQETVTPLSPQQGLETIQMLFESEVDAYLQQLETILAQEDKSNLGAEVVTIAQDLSDLGEVLELPEFNSLCTSVKQLLATQPAREEEIAQAALQAWRRSQAAIMAGQLQGLPSTLNLDGVVEEVVSSPSTADPAPVTDASPARLSSPLDLAPPAELKETQENTVRVPLKQLEQLNDLFGELTIERSGLDLQIERLRNSVKILERKVRSLQQSHHRRRTATLPPSPFPSALPTTSSFLSEVAFSPDSSQLQPNTTPRSPQPTPSIDSGNNLDEAADEASTEVMANLVQLQEVSGDIDLCLQETEQIVGDLNRTAKQLQFCINQLRMRPFADLVGRFPRALRELALQHGKNVELKIQGGDTPIDRSILEALGNPLMHLLRNAFDHGIEDPETRKASGKPEQGTISIEAAYRGNQALITFKDDGRGIALDKVRQRAQHLGLDREAIANASDEEVLTLIFEPGFSTADEVTSLSGRGVGMDVVRTNLRQVRGDIKVETKAGVGTTFTIGVPLTLSVARVLLVESRGILLAFPTTAIEEMLLLDVEQISTIEDKPQLHWKEYSVPLIYLGDWLKFRRLQNANEERTQPLMSAPTVLLIANGSDWVGLQVDRCWGEQEVAIRPVEGNIPMPPGFNGCTILGDGKVVPLINTPELLYWIATSQHPASLEPEDRHRAAAELQNQRPTILVVDDSINVRRLLSLTLEKAGYRVEQGKDGLDALEKLMSGAQIAAVVCDIDMPRLDGYGFLARVKSNPAFQQLPIVMLTSRSGIKERQLALNLGATAFFCKPYDKQQLSETLERLIKGGGKES